MARTKRSARRCGVELPELVRRVLRAFADMAVHDKARGSMQAHLRRSSPRRFGVESERPIAGLLTAADVHPDELSV